MARQAKYTPPNQTTSPDIRSFPSNNAGVSATIMGPRIALLLSVLALVLIGLVMVYSASSVLLIDDGLSATEMLVDQLMFAGIGIVGCFIVYRFIPYHAWLGFFTWMIWAVAIVLLILTAVIGTKVLGAQRWLSLGPVGLQPSEFAKISFLLMAARILFEFRNGDLSLKGALVQAVVVIILPLFIFIFRLQSDLGTTLICLVGILTVMWLGEVPLRIILGVVALGVVFAVIASSGGYRQNRFVFLNPWEDAYDTGYQLIHSFYAFSEGGIFGVGLGNSREKFLYLPEAETDFIFAIIGEELGFLGAFAVIALFLVLLYSGMRVARSAPDSFGAMIAGGCTLMIVFQAFLNIGCVIGVLPTTGKPLPFISSGGSSLIASLLMLGVILSVSRASGDERVYEKRRDDLRVVRVTQPDPGGSRRGGGSARKNEAPGSRAGRRKRTDPGTRGGTARGAASPDSRGRTRATARSGGRYAAAYGSAERPRR